MIVTFAALVLAALPLQSQDTNLVSVQRGDRLEAENHTGDITVRTWTRSAVMLRVRTGARYVELERSPGEVMVSLNWEHGGPSRVDYELTVPTWMPLELSGINTTISVSGTQASVSAETVSGHITVEGGTGAVSAESVEGRVTITGARGRIAAESVNESIVIRNSSGEISAETVNGGITITGVDSRDLSAETINGVISFNGPIRDGGNYSISTHNGDVTLGVQEGANASVSVSTFQGEVSADFPIQVHGSREKDFSFTLGSGSASINIETFQGQIRLVRPTAIRTNR